MKFNKLAGLCLLWICAGGMVCAQEGQPALAGSGAEAASATPDSGKLSKAAFLRIWYLGSPKSQRVTIVCKPDSGDQVVLASYLRAGSFRDYIPLKPGTYVLNLLSGSVLPDDNGKIAPGAPVLAESIKMDLKAGSFGTVVIEDQNGKFSFSNHEDKASPKQSTPVVNVFDYLKAEDVKLRLVNNGNTKEIWTPKLGNVPLGGGAVGAGDCRFELWRTIQGSERATAGYETTLAPNSVCSVVFYQDKYGEPAMSILKDASANVSKEALDQMFP